MRIFTIAVTALLNIIADTFLGSKYADHVYTQTNKGINCDCVSPCAGAAPKKANQHQAGTGHDQAAETGHDHEENAEYATLHRIAGDPDHQRVIRNGDCGIEDRVAEIICDEDKIDNS